jgi:hypothetical protein
LTLTIDASIRQVLRSNKMRETDELIEITKSAEVICEPGFIERMLAEPEIDEDALVRRVYEFANRGTIAAWFNVESALGLNAPEPGQQVPDGIRSEHLRVRSALAAIVSRRVAPKRAEAWRRMAAGVLQVEHRYKVVEVFAGTEPSGLFAVVLCWHLDPRRHFGADICQCQLTSCGKFFFVERGAHRPTRRYCPGTTHGARADDERGSGRARKSYERRKRRALGTRRRRNKQ